MMGLGVRLLPGVVTSTAAIGRTLLALAAMPQPPCVDAGLHVGRYHWTPSDSATRTAEWSPSSWKP